MSYKDPTNQILAAYQRLLSGSLIYGGQAVKVGTKIPRRTTLYVLLFLESLTNQSTGDGTIYNATVAAQITSIQGLGEGDETIVNDVMEQILPFVDNPDAIQMADFKCLTSYFEDMEPGNESDETNYIITKKLRMNHYIEQK